MDFLPVLSLQGVPKRDWTGSVICYHWLMEGPIEGTKHPASIRVNGLEVPLSYTGRLPTQLLQSDTGFEPTSQWCFSTPYQVDEFVYWQYYFVPYIQYWVLRMDFLKKFFTRMFFYKKKFFTRIIFFFQFARIFFLVCPQFFFKKKSQNLSLMGGLRLF